MLTKEFEYSVTDKGVVIHKYIGKNSFVKVPLSIEGKKVVEISTEAFALKYLKKVELPYSIIKIGNRAFERNGDLSEINLPENLSNISKRMFFGCSKIKELTIPYNVKEVGAEAFSGCTNLNKVIFLNENCQIEEGAFRKCVNLQEIILPKFLTEISDSLFENCEKLSEIIIPSTVIRMGVKAFSWCINLQKIILPDKLEEIADRLFEYCTSLEKVTFSKRVLRIGVGSFSWCSKLEEVILGEGLQEIGYNAFLSCKSLKKITLTDGLKALGNCMAYCDSLEEIHIPKTVTKIEGALFPIGKALEKIKIAQDNLNYCDLDGVLFTKDKKILLEYPSAKPDPSYTVPLSVIKINDGAFYTNHFLTSLTIPDGVEIIGKNALAGLNSSSIKIPKTVKKVGLGCFKGSGERFIYNNLDLREKMKSGDYLVIVLSFENEKILYKVWMGDSGESVQYKEALLNSWGEKAYFDFAKMDALFLEMKNFTNKIQVSLARLEYPYNLSFKSEKIYLDYLKNNAANIVESFIDKNNFKGFLEVVKYNFITSDNINSMIEKANRKREVNFLGYLMNYKNENFALDENIFEL